MAFKSGSDYDGATMYGERGAGLTGASDGKVMTGSLWFDRDALTGNQVMIASAGSKTVIKFNTANFIQITAQAAVDNDTILDIRSSAITDLTSWHHVMWMADLTPGDASLTGLWVDGVSDLASSTILNEEIDYTRVNWACGSAVGGGSKYNGALSEVWISIDSWVDLTQAANRALFYDAGKAPVTTGDGLNTPAIYFSAGNSVNNGGDGGNFVNVVAPDSVTGPEESAAGLCCADVSSYYTPIVWEW